MRPRFVQRTSVWPNMVAPSIESHAEGKCQEIQSRELNIENPFQSPESITRSNRVRWDDPDISSSWELLQRREDSKTKRWPYLLLCLEPSRWIWKDFEFSQWELVTREGWGWQQDLEVRMKQHMKKREIAWFFSPIFKTKLTGKEPRKKSTGVFLCRAEQREGQEIDVKIMTSKAVPALHTVGIQIFED